MISIHIWRLLEVRNLSLLLLVIAALDSVFFILLNVHFVISALWYESFYSNFFQALNSLLFPFFVFMYFKKWKAGYLTVFFSLSFIVVDTFVILVFASSQIVSSSQFIPGLVFSIILILPLFHWKVREIFGVKIIDLFHLFFTVIVLSILMVNNLAILFSFPAAILLFLFLSVWDIRSYAWKKQQFCSEITAIKAFLIKLSLAGFPFIIAGALAYVLPLYWTLSLPAILAFAGFHYFRRKKIFLNTIAINFFWTVVFFYSVYISLMIAMSDSPFQFG